MVVTCRASIQTLGVARGLGIEGLQWAPSSSGRGTPGSYPRTVCPVSCASNQALGVPGGSTFDMNVSVLDCQVEPLESGHGPVPEAGAALEDAAGAAAAAAPPWLGTTRMSKYGHGRLRAPDALAPPPATSAPEDIVELDGPSPRLKSEWSGVVGSTSRDTLAGPRSPGCTVVTSTSSRAWVSPTSASTEMVTVVLASVLLNGLLGPIKWEKFLCAVSAAELRSALFSNARVAPRPAVKELQNSTLDNAGISVILCLRLSSTATSNATNFNSSSLM